MKTTLSNYLRFSRVERIGTIGLILATTATFAVPEILHHQHPEKITDFQYFQQQIKSFKAAAGNTSSKVLFCFDPNTASHGDFVRLGLDEKTASSICRYREKGGRFKQAMDFKKIWALREAEFERLLPYIRIGAGSPAEQAEINSDRAAASLFAFDPNAASEEDFVRLGLSPRTAKSILNYRAKGGRFRKAADLEKIYALSEEDFKRIAPFATFTAEKSMEPAVSNPVVYAGNFGSRLVDINHASLEEFKSLPGIGEGRARQLLNFREKLGGFLSIEQVGEMHGLPDSIFLRIQARLALGIPTVRKINLNRADSETLHAHPYISKKQAAVIIAYREQHGDFGSEADLSKIVALNDPVWLAKIQPYLSVKE